MQNNQSIMQISENKDGSAKVLFRIRKAEMTDVDEIMAVMHEAKNDKEHPDWFVSDDEEYVRTHIEEQGFVIVAQTSDNNIGLYPAISPLLPAYAPATRFPCMHNTQLPNP